MFSNAWWLLLLLLVAALGALYVYIQRARRRRALQFANLELLEQVSLQDLGWRHRFRHAPFALLLASLIVLVIAIAGPQAERDVPRNRATVMLVMDISRSMNSTDVAPSRIVASQEAAKNFADDLTDGINLGLISYAGTAATLVSPTPDHNATKVAVDQLRLEDRTATGEGIFAALQQIQTLNAVLGGDEGAPPARIVLLSDGKETVPENPDDPRGAFTAARKASEEGVPISTISFGTMTGTVELEGERVPVPVDDDSLREIANLSEGDFYTASSLEELNQVYDTLQQQIGYERVRGDDYWPWLITGAMLALISAFAGMTINQRLP